MVQSTRLLILGATHLGRTGRREPDEALEGIVSRMVGWRPDAIAIEALPGELVDSYRRLGGPYADLSVGGMPAAISCAEAVRDLHSWDLWAARRVGEDRSRSVEERIIAWCAAYEPFTALLLAHRTTDLPDEVRAALDAVAATGDERVRIAGEAAVRLELERLHPFDDHSNWAAFAQVSDEEYAEGLRAVNEHARRHPQVVGLSALVEAAISDADLWPFWRRLNSPEEIDENERLESGSYVADVATGALPRKALAGWRARNLLMAAHLRSVLGEYPGGRVLALVGHSHKGPIEAALGVGQWDVELADVSELG